MSFQDYYYNLGYGLEKQSMEKTAGRTAATLAGAIPGPFGTVASTGLAEDKRGISTAGGQLVGAIGGGVTGTALGFGSALLAKSLGVDALNGVNENSVAQAIMALGGLTGSMAGGALGAYAGHGEDREKQAMEKQAIDPFKALGTAKTMGLVAKSHVKKMGNLATGKTKPLNHIKDVIKNASRSVKGALGNKQAKKDLFKNYKDSVKGK